MQIYSFSVVLYHLTIGAYSESDYLGLNKSLTWNLRNLILGSPNKYLFPKSIRNIYFFIIFYSSIFMIYYSQIMLWNIPKLLKLFNQIRLAM